MLLCCIDDRRRLVQELSLYATLVGDFATHADYLPSTFVHSYDSDASALPIRRGSLQSLFQYVRCCDDAPIAVIGGVP
jgi:hypothetical protein